MQLIGIAGRKRSGKTVLAGLLAAALLDNGETVSIDGFAIPLFREVKLCRGVDVIDKDRDRPLLQRFASAVLPIHPLWLIRHLARRNDIDGAPGRRSAGFREQADYLIVGDVRRPNEAEFIGRRGVLIFVEGSREPLEGETAEHESESHADELRAMADIVVMPCLKLEDVDALARWLVHTRAIVKKNALDGKK